VDIDDARTVVSAGTANVTERSRHPPRVRADCSRRPRLGASTVGCVSLAFALAGPAAAAPVDPRTTLYDGPDGATCDYFNAGARIPWHHRGGDWRDAAGQQQGDKPMATARIQPTAGRGFVQWDVTDRVRESGANASKAAAFLLAPVKGEPRAETALASREAPEARIRPRLRIDFDDGSPAVFLVPSADTTLDCSTVSSLGARARVAVGETKYAAIAFDVRELADRPIKHATLELVPIRHDGAAVVGVYSLHVPVAENAVATQPVGITSRFHDDKAIADDPDVVFMADFDTLFWRSEWSYVSPGSHAEAVQRDDDGKFEPFRGAALRVTIPKGGNLGLDMGYNFQDKLGMEPEEIYFRYYIRFADDWIPTLDGGKLPGPSGTYGRAGWGGRKANAREGWSLRGLFLRASSAANPLHGRVAIGTYAYHAAGEDFFGDEWDWNLATQLLERNQWYCLEQHVKMNTPGAQDGVLRAWIDDVPAFEKRDLYLRDTPVIKIEKIWMNVYHGGTAKAVKDLDLYIDNVVIARRRIGCLAH
jgi:hypothetical protein